jgi:flagellar export protein FliJ
MIDRSRNVENLNRLLKLAHADADTLRIDLADIEKARGAAQASLERLDDLVRQEEASLSHSPKDLAAFIEGARLRRHNLKTTVMSLSDAEEAARERLRSAFVEMKKVEHLIGIEIAAADKENRRRETAAADEFGNRRTRLA